MNDKKSMLSPEELESVLTPVEFDGTGRGEEYNSLCEFIRNCPEVIGYDNDNVKSTMFQKPLSSQGELDVYFELNDGRRVGMIVKPSTATENEMTYGLFQCVKYKAVMEALLKLKGEQYSTEIIFVTRGTLSEKNRKIADNLGIKTHEKIGLAHVKDGEWSYTYKFARELMDIACQRNLKSIYRLEELKKDGWRRDDSFLGHPAKNHVMYKLGEPLISRDGSRAYEFLIEFDVNDPSIGIYYGVKGLTLEGNHREQIERYISEFYGISINDIATNQLESNILDPLSKAIPRYLNAIFPHKDFHKRLRFTDNANDNTFWPFWIASDPEEDVIEETARAVALIRKLYKAKADETNGELFELSDSNCPISHTSREKLKYLDEIKCPGKTLKNENVSLEFDDRAPYIASIRFSHVAHKRLYGNLGNESNRRFFDRLIQELRNHKIAFPSIYLEHGYEVVKNCKVALAIILRKFYDLLDQNCLYYKGVYSLFEDIPYLFMSGDEQMLTQEYLSRDSGKRRINDSRRQELENIARTAYAYSMGVLK